MDKRKPRVAVIGGGITGLSAAYYAAKQLRENGANAEVTVLEGSAAFGGKIATVRRDGFVIERGPDSFLARKLPIIELTRELGLEHELTGQNPDGKKSYIYHKGKLHRIPKGFVLGIPTELGPFMTTGLISPAGKARAALDLVLPRRTEPGDESLGGFLERRLGREVLANVAEPLLAGIYAGDTHELSLRATFPQFHEVERKHRSLILGMMAGKQQAAQPKGLPEIAKNNVFLTYRNGLITLVEALVRTLRESGADVRANAKAKAIERTDTGWRIEIDGGEPVEADAVVCTLPTYAASGLFPDLPAVRRLGDMPHVSVANVIVAFDRADVPMRVNGSGFLIPRTAGRFITACTWTSEKWLHTAPAGKALIRCYVGRSGEEQWTGMTDEEILAGVRRDLRELMGITAEPQLYYVTRLYRSMPQYPVGHPERIEAAERELAERRPGVYLTGAGFRGVGLPDCIRQGKVAAMQAVAFVTA